MTIWSPRLNVSRRRQHERRGTGRTEQHDSSETEGFLVDTRPTGSRILREKRPERETAKEYFLGGLILYRAVSVWYLYDGLQRLTSLTIVLTALERKWSTISPTDAQTLHGLLFQDQEHRRRLIVPTPGATLSSLVKGDDPRALQVRELTLGDRNMREASKILQRRFEAAHWTSDRRSQFLNFLCEHVKLSVVEVTNQSLAYQMFVGDNTRGLRLGVGDVLKGLIAEQVRTNSGTVGQVNHCADGWRQAQRKLGTGFDDFIHAYEVHKFRGAAPESGRRPYVERHNTGEELAELFNERTKPEVICDWVTNEFTPLTDVFQYCRAHLFERTARGVDIEFKQLSFLSWTDWQPLFLGIADKYETTDKNFGSMIRALKRACYIIELNEWSDGTRRRNFAEALDQLEQNKNPFSKGRSWHGALHLEAAADEAKQRLRQPLTSRATRSAIVHLVETVHWGDAIPLACTSRTNVEHILPGVAKGQWLDWFSETEHDDLVDTLGNLCVLDRQANGDISNSPWPTKTIVYERWRASFKSLDDVMAHAGPPEKPWDAAILMARTERLARLAEKALFG
jgi:Protein of unknown function DUF262/Protein of unknown function (DUF1524)